jgi:hypothetical protein
MAMWYILWLCGVFCALFGIFCVSFGILLVVWYTLCFVWYILWSFGTISPFWFILYHEKSGNPAAWHGWRRTSKKFSPNFSSGANAIYDFVNIFDSPHTQKSQKNWANLTQSSAIYAQK